MFPTRTLNRWAVFLSKFRNTSGKQVLLKRILICLFATDQTGNIYICIFSYADTHIINMERDTHRLCMKIESFIRSRNTFQSLFGTLWLWTTLGVRFGKINCADLAWWANCYCPTSLTAVREFIVTQQLRTLTGYVKSLSRFHGCFVLGEITLSRMIYKQKMTPIETLFRRGHS